MKLTRVLLAIVSLTAAVSVLAISLASSVPSVYSAGEKFKSNDRQFYMDGEILPDHILYPAVMVADRIKLETATPTEQIYIYTTYANLRLESTLELLDKDNRPLALTTLTKSQKYLLKAASQVIELDSSDNTKNHVLKTIEYHMAKHKEIKDLFDDQQRVVIDGLDKESEVYVNQLQSNLQAEN